MGEARTAISGTFPLVGVAPAAKVVIPGDLESSGRTRLEPHHSHIVLVPAETWADGVPWIDWVVAELAGQRRSVTVLVDGGDVSRLDTEASIAGGRPVLAVAGTGRVADEIAATVTGQASNAQVQGLAATGLLTAADFAEGPQAVATAVARILEAS